MIARRSFLAGAGAALFAPQMARAQVQRPKRVAIMSPVHPLAEMKPDRHPWFIAFHDEIKRLGWQEGGNLVTDIWSGAGRSDRDEFVHEVYASKPDVIFAASYRQFTQQLLREATSIPTVITGPDPLATGIVRSLARPGGMITGFSSDGGIELSSKRLQLLAEGLPGVRRVAYFGPRYDWENVQKSVVSAANRLGLAFETVIFEAAVSDADYRRSFQAIAAIRPGAVLLAQATENSSRAQLIAELALAERLPAIGHMRDLTASGLLMSYGANYPTIYRGCAGYVDRILRGAKPSDLPVQQPTIFEFVVNLKTAKAIGVQFPDMMLALVDEALE